MRNRSRLLLFCLAAFAAHAVATTLPESCGNDKVKFNVSHSSAPAGVGLAEPGKAQVIFIESLDTNARCIGCEITARIGVDGNWAGADKGNSYFVASIDPGTHNLCANWQSVNGYLKNKVAMASLSAESGKTYYYKVNVSLASYAFDLVPVTEDEAKFRLKNASLSVAKASK